jgi:5-methylcytosine-specific restriction endonuclease McrA
VADDDLLTERLLRVVDEGRRTATYKLALLLALIDSAALAPGADVVGTHDVAELVLEHYYPQARRYLGGDGVERDLQQISMKTSSVWSTMLKLRILGDNAHCRGVSEVRSRLVEEYANAVDVIEDTFVRYPIPLLQVVGNRVVPFLYEVGWPEGTSVATLRRQGRDQVRFLAGVTDRLVVLGPLLRPLIELHWTRDVARWTRLSTEDDRLHAHLFGSDRVAFPPDVRAGLSALQDGACFYCGSPLTSTAQVDHFLAWSRFPNDAIENLVLADRCNGDKSDHLAAPMHLDRWVDRCLARERDLRGLADETRWRSDSTRSRALVRSTYGHVAPGTPLWVGGKDFVEAEGPVFMRG